jgi:hypothetical protein
MVLTPTFLLNHSTEVSRKPGGIHAARGRSVVGFISPSDSGSYNLTLAFGGKFTTIVPAWFEVSDSSFDHYSVSGAEHISPWWLSAMRSRWPHVRIVPRVVFTVAMLDFLHDYQEISAAAAKALGALSSQFDGLFLEFPTYFTTVDTAQLVPHVLRTVRKALPRRGRLYIALPAEITNPYGPKHTSIVKQLIAAVDYVYLPVCGFVDEQSLSPIDALNQLQTWASGLKALAKTIVGLPFFGLDFSPAGTVRVSWSDMVERLKRFKVIIAWVQLSLEHGFFFSDGKKQHIVYYPTLAFLKDRFDRTVAAKFAGFGLAEIESGAPYFFDLL